MPLALNELPPVGVFLGEGVDLVVAVIALILLGLALKLPLLAVELGGALRVVVALL
jgi:Sec-independent protein translocase protein TatA